jgi:menaquinone-dependent protoporphyrinogen oxidase
MIPSRVSRRRFLWMTGGAVGAGALTYTALTLAGISQSPQSEINLIESTYGEENAMNDKILVTYASQTGSTGSVADAIGKTLAECGVMVEVRPMNDVQDLTPYRAVVAGSAIHGAKWLPEAMEFLHTHRSELSQKPFAAFLVCITLGMPDAAKYREGVAKWMEPVSAVVMPRSVGLFAGSMDLKKLPFTFNALMVRAAVSLGVLPNGDHRDWAEIRSWAAALPRTLA